MKKWITYITPFLILAAAALITIVIFLLAGRNHPAEAKFMYLKLLLPVIITMIILDIGLRFLLKKQRWIILVELLLLFASIYFWIIHD